jgi:hypothetical protein
MLMVSTALLSSPLSSASWQYARFRHSPFGAFFSHSWRSFAPFYGLRDTYGSPDQAMQVTAGRFMPRHFVISASPLQLTLAPASRT